MNGIWTSEKTRLVRVEGRDDLGQVVESGHNFGDRGTIRCVGLYFPLDGLCAYYAVNKVTFVDE